MEKSIEALIRTFQRKRLETHLKINQEEDEKKVLILSGKIIIFDYCIRELQFILKMERRKNKWKFEKY